MARTRYTGTNYNDTFVQNSYRELDIYTYAGNDRITLNNTGSYGGNNYVVAGDGNDTVTNYYEGGNTIYLGNGNDRYVADIRVRDVADYDEVFGGAGHDRFEINSVESDYFGESGNDTFLSVGYRNYFNGGSGIDTINFSMQDSSTRAGRGVTLDLGAQYATTGSDSREVLIGIENAVGTRVADDIVGSSVNNVLNGMAGNDILEGLAGNDTLYGSTGNDRLYGGTGNDILAGGSGYDVMTGGSGADDFLFTSRFDSPASSARDVITDFSHAAFDLIDLSRIDADSTWSGNQSFDFIGSDRFSGEAGELNFRGGIVSADIDGDGLADFQIRVSGVTTLYSNDFVL